MFDEYVRPACLPAMSWGENFQGGKMIASGIGYSKGNQRAGSLKIATIDMKSKQKCRQVYQSFFPGPYKGTLELQKDVNYYVT